MPEEGKGGVAGYAGVLGSDNPLGEDEIHNVEEDCAGLDEDVGGETEADVVWVRRPGEAQDHSYDAAHAEA